MSLRNSGGLSLRSFRWNKEDVDADPDSDRKQLIPKVEDVEDPAQEDDQIGVGAGRQDASARASRGALCNTVDYNALFFLCERQTWYSVDRLVSLFCRIQRVDVVVAVITLAVTVSQFSYNGGSEGQELIPNALVTLIWTLNLCCPLVGIGAAKTLRRRLLLVATLTSTAIKLGFTSIALAIYLTAEVGPSLGFVTEALALSVCNYLIGVFTVSTGMALYSALVRMYKCQRTVAFIGLDSAGKSLLLSHIVPRSESSTTEYILPTGGVELKQVKKWDTLWKIWDLSGQRRNRWMWNYYLSQASAIVFVVDTSDLERLATARAELHKVLGHADVIRNLPRVVILANKSDLTEHETAQNPRLTTSQLEQALAVGNVNPDIRCKYFSTNGISGAGIEDALQWILETTTNFEL